MKKLLRKLTRAEWIAKARKAVEEMEGWGDPSLLKTGLGNKSGGISTDGDLVGGKVTQTKQSGQVTIKYQGMTITGRNISIGGKKIVVNGKIVDPDFKDDG